VKFSTSGATKPLFTVIAAGLTLAACAPGPYPANGGPSPANTQPPVSGAATVGTTTSQPGGSSNAGGTPTCTSADLSLSMQQVTADLGTKEGTLVFTNKTATSCVMAGFPGVSVVSAVNQGQQVGAAADRQGPTGPQVTLAPSQSAAAPLSWVDGGTLCDQPVPVAGFRVYPPNETESMFVALDQSKGQFTACTNTTDMHVGAVVSGTEAPPLKK
jgi:hypothetical protein